VVGAVVSYDLEVGGPRVCSNRRSGLASRRKMTYYAHTVRSVSTLGLAAKAGACTRGGAGSVSSYSVLTEITATLAGTAK
jgi:hypothetical protein